MSYVAPAASGPGLMLGYYRPPLSTRDGVVLQILADVLYGGRSSRLQRQLVQRGRALSASMVASYPGAKHAGLSLVLAEPAKGVALEKLDRELRDVLAQVADGGVTAVELQRVKKDTTGTLFDIIASNSSAASALASYQATTGSWRGLLEEVAFVESLTPQVVQAEAQRLFADANCFTGYILPTAAKAAAAAARA